MNTKITELGNPEINNAYITILDIIHSRRRPNSAEFMKYVYPLLEVAFVWNTLKKDSSLDEEFYRQAQKRMYNLGNYYGTIFELDMALRCLLSNWDIKYVEDVQEQNTKQIDYLFVKEKEVVGVECLSKRFSISARENIGLDSIITDINCHADKFKPEHISKLNSSLDKKVLVIEITNSDYCKPKQILTDFQKMSLPNNLDDVVMTWREDMVNGNNHSLKVKYCGLISQISLTTTYAAEFTTTAFFLRKYTQNEPTWGKPGKEEYLGNSE